MRTLNLGYNPLGPASGPALASLLLLTPGLLELGLQSCGLEGSILERHTGLGQALKGNTAAMLALLNSFQFVHQNLTSHIYYHFFILFTNTCTHNT